MFNMFSNPQAEKYRNTLRLYEEEHPPAWTTGATECQGSGYCCWKRPGSLTQEDVKCIAEHLGLSQGGFFMTYCMVDEFDEVFTVIFRRKHQTGGKYITTAESWSVETPCVMLNEDRRCVIHDNKPAQCAKNKCWDTNLEATKPSWTEKELTALGWDGEV